MTITRRALAGGLLLGPLGAAQAQVPTQTQRPAEPDPGCTHCKARLQTVDALRQRLPAAWQVQLDPEPVLGGQILTVRAGPADAPPLLLVHGLGQNGFTDWMPVLPTLARNWRVLAVDLPGFGYSSSPDAKLSPTNYAQVLKACLDRHLPGAVSVVGHSMGGAVALRLAAQEPARVSRLVLVDVAGILHRTAFTKHSASLQMPAESMPEPLREPVARLRGLGQELIERLFGLPVDPTEVLRSNDWLWGRVLRDRNNVNAALALVDENFSAAVHTLQTPVRLIWGDADTIAPLRTGELLARRLPQAQLDTLRGIGHVPMAQDSGGFMTLLNRALQQPPAPRSDPPLPADPPTDLLLRGESNRRYSGRWRELRIENCTGLQLTDVVADRIVVRDSALRMTGVQVQGAEIALDIAGSELEATACDLGGRQAIRCDASRLDLAGVRLTARGFAVQALRPSRLVASVSRIDDVLSSGWWHEDRMLENELLDPRAPPRAPAR